MEAINGSRSTSEIENCHSKPQTGTMKKIQFSLLFCVLVRSKHSEDCDFNLVLIRLVTSQVRKYTYFDRRFLVLS